MRKRDRLAVLVFLALLSPGFVRAENQPIEAQILDAMDKLWGVHRGFRTNHAKGIVAEGSFKALPEAAALSRATLFAGTTIPVIVPFSDGSGFPDGAPAARPHSMTMKFQLPRRRSGRSISSWTSCRSACNAAR